MNNIYFIFIFWFAIFLSLGNANYLEVHNRAKRSDFGEIFESGKEMFNQAKDNIPDEFVEMGKDVIKDNVKSFIPNMGSSNSAPPVQNFPQPQPQYEAPSFGSSFQAPSHHEYPASSHFWPETPQNEEAKHEHHIDNSHDSGSSSHYIPPPFDDDEKSSVDNSGTFIKLSVIFVVLLMIL